MKKQKRYQEPQATGLASSNRIIVKSFTIELDGDSGSMVVAELLGEENGILIIVGVDHVGFQSYVPFCVGDAGKPKVSVVRIFTLEAQRLSSLGLHPSPQPQGPSKAHHLLIHVSVSLHLLDSTNSPTSTPSIYSKSVLLSSFSVSLPPWFLPSLFPTFLFSFLSFSHPSFLPPLLPIASLFVLSSPLSFSPGWSFSLLYSQG